MVSSIFNKEAFFACFSATAKNQYNKILEKTHNIFLIQLDLSLGLHTASGKRIKAQMPPICLVNLIPKFDKKWFRDNVLTQAYDLLSKDDKACYVQFRATIYSLNLHADGFIATDGFTLTENVCKIHNKQKNP